MGEENTNNITPKAPENAPDESLSQAEVANGVEQQNSPEVRSVDSASLDHLAQVEVGSAPPPAPDQQIADTPVGPVAQAAAQPQQQTFKPAPYQPQPQQQQQPQPAVAAQHLASVPPSTATPPTASQPQQHRVSLAKPDLTRLAANPPISAEEKRRAEAARYLRAARINLKANNLSATKSRIAAALAAQPDNREAQRLRATVHTLEQQRDALLSLARSCGSIGHLACASRDAGIALQIDSSSKTARRLSTQATRESELQIAPSADTATEPLPDVRNVNTHH